MGRTCSTYGGVEVNTGFWDGNLRRGDYLEDPGIDKGIVLKWIFENWDRGMDWTHLAQDRDRCRGDVNAVMNLRVPQNAGHFLIS
jgi:hypothetical protein